MLAKPDRVRLQHMLDASREAIGYAQGRSRGDLGTDTMLTRALVKCIEIVGEAASRTSAEARKRAAAIPWAQINAMRNRLIHAYFDINLDAVCRLARHDAFVRDAARRKGMRLLREEGILKIAAGLAAVGEVLRTTS